MSGKPDQWTRRQFAQAAAACSLLGWKALAATPGGATGFAYVGSSSDGDSGAIHVFRVSGSRWTAIQKVFAAAPAYLVAHPTLPVLYAVHHVGLWNDLPRGAISAYAVASGTGQLTLLHTQPLSLSATYPRHAAVSPDGRYLLATSERGGLYNLLPIDLDGALEPPCAIRKEVGLDEGSTGKTAAPRQAVFHPDGATLLTADTGQEAVTAFAYDHETIHVLRRVRVHPGAGSSQVVLSPAGDWLYSQHATDGSIAAHRLNNADRSWPVHVRTVRQAGHAIMAMHPGGRFLITASPGLLTSFLMNPDSGRLSEAAALSLPESLQVLTCPADGSCLLGIGRTSGHVLRWSFNAISGALGEPRLVAQAGAASSLLFRPDRL